MSPPPPPPPPGYQSFGGGNFAGAGAVPHPRGTIVLVLGILSIVCFGILAGIPGIVMGTSALKEIDANPGRYSNRGTVNAGRICAIVGTALSVLGIIVLLARK